MPSELSYPLWEASIEHGVREPPDTNLPSASVSGPKAYATRYGPDSRVC